jgi:tripartite-type tricarboxylate transporter receptor subunit TctC
MQPRLKTNLNRYLQTLITLLGVVCTISIAQAEEFASRPIKIVVAQAAGGGMDSIARLLGTSLSEKLHQPVIIENKTGAGGIIGTDYVAKSNPDGYTLILAPIGNMVFAPILRSNLKYNPTKDFTPIATIAKFPLIVLVNSKTNISNFSELLEFMKKNPDLSNFGGSGPAFQFPAEQLKIRAHISAEFIQYKSMAETINALMAGDILAAFVDPGPAKQGLDSGKLKPLAVTSGNRLSTLSQTPTINELGYPELQLQYWTGIFGPNNIPKNIVSILESNIKQIVSDAAFEKSLITFNVQPLVGGSKDLEKLLEDDLRKWSTVAKQANIQKRD